MNFAAYPFVGSLLAHVAKDIYALDQRGMGWLIACFAAGALAGSVVLATNGARIRAARTMIVCALLWFVANPIFSWITVPLWGEAMLVVDRLRAKLLHGPDGGHPAAHRRSRVPRAGDGRAHARRLRPAARHAAERPILIEHWGFAVTGTLFGTVVSGLPC